MTRHQSNAALGMFAAVPQYINKTSAHLKDDTLMTAGVTNFNISKTFLLIEPDITECNLEGKEHTATTTSLQSLFSEATAQLHVPDDLVKGLAEDGDEDFVTGYLAVRKINYGHGRGGNAKPPKKEA